MKPKEAIQLLDNAVAMLQVNRDTHVKLQEAITVIKNYLLKENEKTTKEI